MKNIKHYDSFNSNVNESSFENKTFNVCLRFFREEDRDPYIIFERELDLPTLEGREEDRDMLILGALSDSSMLEEGPNASADLRKIEEDFGISKATIIEFAKNSKSLEDFEFFVHEKLVRDNFPMLIKNFIARDGEEDTTIEEILDDNSWMSVYGCEFDIIGLLPRIGNKKTPTFHGGLSTTHGYR
jgi:hypothetical protein